MARLYPAKSLKTGRSETAIRSHPRGYFGSRSRGQNRNKVSNSPALAYVRRLQKITFGARCATSRADNPIQNCPDQV